MTRHLRLVPPDGKLMPRTRAECVDGPRPCRWTRRRWHLAADAEFSCVLDIADEGGVEQIQVARALGVSRETVRQDEEKALRKLAR